MPVGGMLGLSAWSATVALLAWRLPLAARRAERYTVTDKRVLWRRGGLRRSIDPHMHQDRFFAGLRSLKHHSVPSADGTKLNDPAVAPRGRLCTAALMFARQALPGSLSPSLSPCACWIRTFLDGTTVEMACL